MPSSESNFKDPIWALSQKWKGKFYNALSICGIVVFTVTIFTKWDDWGWNALLDLFNDIGTSIFSLVVVVWFACQAADWVIPRFETFKAVINKLRKIMG